MTLPSGLALPLEEIAGLCRRYHVRELSVFGSAARGGLRPDSDIDLLVEFAPEASVGLLLHSRLERDFSTLLGRRVDLVSKRALRPAIRAMIFKDAHLLYAA
ncbi:MAG: nucleotidyltransferase family protein [Acidobacteria bacterium]|nr:nucleotidyltransferase family protein [Acidobacteriota bacterium]